MKRRGGLTVALVVGAAALVAVAGATGAAYGCAGPRRTTPALVPAWEKLYGLIRERRVVHDGDPTLRSHVLAAVAQLTERGQRISKRKSLAHIDACVALAYAAALPCARDDLDPPWAEVV
jgi:hypothetical protein